MGKPFSKELSKLPETIAWANALDISPIQNFFSGAVGRTLITIGAGGSFTNAELARMLFEANGGLAISHTPQSFIQNSSYLRDSDVLIYTASGNNKDIIGVFNSAVRREARNVFVICGSSRSKIRKIVETASRARIFTMPLPTGRDGYLATNSLIAFAAVTSKGFGHEVSGLALPSTIELEAQLSKSLQAPNFYIGLYGDWARPPAFDFESKFSEAGLAGVMAVDYRNFAHGRHNWLDKRGDSTTVIAFLTPESAALAEKTLALLPKSISIVRIATPHNGPLGALDLTLKVFQLTEIIGKRRGIDPGRPGVPQYGRKIYHVGPASLLKPKSNLRDSIRLAAGERKLAARGNSGNKSDQKCVQQAAVEYARKLEAVEFGAVVLDFDGTVANPGIGEGALGAKVTTFLKALITKRIPVFFATGRGDSIHKIIEATFSKKLWGNIHVSYYNGAKTLCFVDRNALSHDTLPSDSLLEESLDSLNSDDQIARIASISRKPYQISLKANKGTSSVVMINLVGDLVARVSRGALRVVQSSHSIDIIPIATSKRSCLVHAQQYVAKNLEVLTIGDRGAFPGNDFDLLAHPYSLSVDTVSTDLNSCWNFLPRGCQNVSGFEYYCAQMRLAKARFSLRLL